MTDIQQIKSVINESMLELKRELLTQQEKAENRITSKITDIPEFRKKGNKKQYEFNAKVDESVSVSDLKKLTKIYVEILKNYFK